MPFPRDAAEQNDIRNRDETGESVRLDGIADDGRDDSGGRIDEY